MTSAMETPDVLVVDDDPVALAGVGGALREAGYTVAEAPSGAQALSAAVALHPRVMILDASMPDLDGFSVCEQLRTDGLAATMPILFLSSSAAIERRIRGLRAGAVDFLAKPCDSAELLARIGTHLQIVRRRESLQRSNRDLAEFNRRLRADVDAASRVQAALLPSEDALDPSVRFACRCLQCDTLGGDAVGILRLRGGLFLIYVLDASGHGVPASLLAVPASYLVTAIAEREPIHGTPAGPVSPASVIGELNRLFGRHSPPGGFITLLVGIVDVPGQSLTFCAAGHPGPVLLRACREPELLDEPAPPLGIREWPYADRTIPFGPGDRLVFYTDGVFEQRSAAGEPFGRARLLRLIGERSRQPTGAAIDHIVQSLARWRGDRPMDDDTTLLAIDYSFGGRRSC